MLAAISWTTVSMVLLRERRRGDGAGRGRLSRRAREELAREGLEGLRLDRRAHLAHQLLVVMQVVDRVQARGEDLAAAIQVVQVGAGIIAAGVAGAARIERCRIV